MHTPRLTIKQIKEKASEFLDKCKDAQTWKDADAIEEQVKYQIATYFDNYPVEFIIEVIANFRHDVSILTDNEGYWCVNNKDARVTVESFCYPIATEGWMPSIKEAVRWYVKENWTCLRKDQEEEVNE